MRTEKENALVRAMDNLKGHVVRYYENWFKKLEFKPYFAFNSRIDGMKYRITGKR